MIFIRGRTQQPQQDRRLRPEFEKAAFLALPGQPRPALQALQTVSYPVDTALGLWTSGIQPRNVTRALSRNGPGVTTTDGTGYAFARLGSGGASDAYIETPSGSDFTWVFQTDKVGYVGTNPGYFRNSSSGGSTFILTPTSGLWVRLNGTDFTSATAMPAAGSTITVVVSVRSGVSVKGWVNGVRVLNASTAATSGDLTSINGVNYFGTHNGTEYLTGNHTIVGHWHRAFTDAVAESLSINPWAMFAAPPRRLWIAPAAAGGGITATFTKTEAADTLAAGVTTASVASLTKTENADTLASAATEATVAAATLTENADTLSSGSTDALAASLSLTEAADTLAATSADAVVVALTATEAPDTLAATMAQAGGADAAITEAADTVAAASTLAEALALATTDAADTVSAAATTAEALALARTEAPDTLVADVLVPTAGGIVVALDITDESDLVSSTATVSGAVVVDPPFVGGGGSGWFGGFGGALTGRGTGNTPAQRPEDVDFLVLMAVVVALELT